MKILIIPSWYPHPENPLAGKFFVDQAIALQKHSQHHYYLLNFGQNQYQLSMRRAHQSLRHLRNWRRASNQTQMITERLQEIRIPHLSWTAHLLKGNLAAFDVSRLPKVDLVYAQVSFPGAYLASRIAIDQGIPYVVAEHSGPFPLPDFCTGHAVSKLVLNSLKGAKAIIAVSSHLQKQIFDSTGIETILIPNMVDCEYFVTQDTHSDKLRLFSMTPFTRAKGVEDLADALQILDSQGLDFHLHWAGEGPLKRRIMQRCLPLAHKIRFTNYLNREQARNAFRNCDIYVMPSRLESFSMVLIEAMSCGKPFVATDCGGPRDIAMDGLGLLAPVQDSGALARAILNLAENLKDYQTEVIRKHCRMKYSEEVVCQSLLDVFERVSLPQAHY